MYPWMEFPLEFYNGGGTGGAEKKLEINTQCVNFPPKLPFILELYQRGPQLLWITNVSHR